MCVLRFVQPVIKCLQALSTSKNDKSTKDDMVRGLPREEAEEVAKVMKEVKKKIDKKFKFDEAGEVEVSSVNWSYLKQ